MVKTILFDLDGTLTDSGEGIINCVKMTFERFGLPIPCQAELRTFVGPPLGDSFIRHGIPTEQADEAIRIFRSRYLTVGKFENHPYPGIVTMLDALKCQGHQLYVATSKPEETAIEVLEHFDLAKYFSCICGASFDRTRVSKSDVIAYLLKKSRSSGKTIMVGDTAYDVIGASAHGIETIGVSWGYGKAEDIRQAGAIAIADSPEKLLAIIDSIH